MAQRSSACPCSGDNPESGVFINEIIIVFIILISHEEPTKEGINEDNVGNRLLQVNSMQLIILAILLSV